MRTWSWAGGGATAGALLAATVLGGACGGNAFTAGPTDAGPTTVEGSVDAGSDADSAAAGDSSADTGGPVEAGATLTGTVVDQFGLPMAGVGVHAQSHATTTAADGTFTLSGITTPYDINVVVAVSGGHKHGYVFKSVGRHDPTLQLVAERSGTAQATTLAGTMSTNGPTAAGIVFADLPAAATAATSNTITIPVGGLTYTGQISWFGSASVSANLYVLQWLVTGGVPSGFIAYTSSAHTLTGGQSATWDPAPSSSLAQATLTVDLNVTAGFSPLQAAVYLRPPGAQIAALIGQSTHMSTASAQFETPVISGATFVACGVQVPNGSTQGTDGPFGAACQPGLSGNASPALTLPAPTSFVSPPSVATLGTTFTYDVIPGGVSFVGFGPAGNTGDSVYVVTTASDVVIPDLTLLGVVVPPGQMYDAEVFGFAPFPTMDSALGPSGFDAALIDLGLGQGPAAAGAVAHGAGIAFTTQ